MTVIKAVLPAVSLLLISCLTFFPQDSSHYLSPAASGSSEDRQDENLAGDSNEQTEAADQPAADDVDPMQEMHVEQDVPTATATADANSPTIPGWSGSSPASGLPQPVYTFNYGEPELMQTSEGPLRFDADVITNLCNWNDDRFPDLLIASDGQMYVVKGFAANNGSIGFEAPEPILIDGFSVSGKPRLGPLLTDLNADGLEDLVINYPAERMTVFYNQGSSSEPRFSGGVYLPGSSGDLAVYKKTYGLFAFTDWDNDGDSDLVTGRQEGRLTLHQNTGSAAAPRFDTGRSLTSYNGELSLPYRPSPRFHDLDGNGIQDLVIGRNWADIQAYTRITGDENKDFDQLMDLKDDAGEPLGIKETTGGNSYPVLVDLDSDGVADLVTGSAGGGIYFLRGSAEGVVGDFGSPQERFIKGVVASSEAVNTVKFDRIIYDLSSEDLVTLFRAYFEDHYWNLNLRWNMRYPAYSWHSNHRNVQASLAVVLPEQIENFILGKSAARIQAELADKPELLEHYFSILSYLALGLKSDNNLLTTNEVERMYRLFASISEDSQLGPAWTYPQESWGELNILRGQLGLTLYSCARILGKSPDEIVRSLGYDADGGSDTEAQQLRRDLIREYDTLILDNGSLSTQHYRKMDEIQSLLPQHLIFPRAILTFYEYHDLEESPVTIHKVGCVTNVFNVFASSVDTPGGNQFNPAWGDVRTARFFSMFMHELNHGVDSNYITTQPRLNDVKNRLIEEAGRNHENYLRDKFDDGFFADKPQEFFASISNMYFTSSRDAFAYALDEMDRGDMMAMRQFLFFASVYTDGGNCYFYRITPEAEMSREAIAVTMENDLIHSLTLDGRRYDFSNLWQGY